MLITNTITKNALERIVQETFLKLGSFYSSAILDSLKLLGFYYATAAGISINTEDLKTPKIKEEFLRFADYESKKISDLWAKGLISDNERFQNIIDSWNTATESLKTRIVEYYKNFDPANNLYIMAFSGARGNMSQVRQLIGMRGLMSDQEGKIIDLPIHTNFREGLTSIDYMISSYGARKGIVDTALKTADSGYLTRRLVYTAQDLVIRELQCASNEGITAYIDANTNIKNIVGRILLSAKNIKDNAYINTYKNIILTPEVINALIKNESPILNLRSPLTCRSYGSICQACYGWDLSKKKLISLGDAVGVTAAQSIGEPGTQLTMRTFHTGGIFTSETVKQTLALFTGIARIPSNLKGLPYRTVHGNVILKLQQNLKFTIETWNNDTNEIYLEAGSFLYIKESAFVKKDTLLAEQPTRTIIAATRQFKPIYSALEGEIRFEKLIIKNINREDKAKIKLNQENGLLWVMSGKILSLPKEACYTFLKHLSHKKILARLQISTPYSGIFYFNNNSKEIFIKNKIGTFSLKIISLLKQIKGCKLTLSILPKNYQNVDSYTTIAYINIYANFFETVHLLRKKESLLFTNYFLVCDSDTWQMNSDLTEMRYYSKMIKGVKTTDFFNNSATFSNCGFLLKKDGFQYIFQKAMPIFLSRNAILNYKQGDLIYKKGLLATLVNYIQQTEDIVQGLPKIEELIEARRPKYKAELSRRPGVLLTGVNKCLNKSNFLNPELISNSYISLNQKTFKNSFKIKNQHLNIVHSLAKNNNFIYYNAKLWKIHTLPVGFVPFQLDNRKEFCFTNKKGIALLININGKKYNTGWLPVSATNSTNTFYYINTITKKYENLKIENKYSLFENKKTKNLILKIKENLFIFLEPVNVITEYILPTSSKIIGNPGSFIDIGEPITEGLIDPHELLLILFTYHLYFDGIFIGTLRSLNKFQLILANSIQSIYHSQGVNISSKHIEIIIRQMTAKVLIKNAGNTPLLPGEIIRLTLILEIYKALNILGQKRTTKFPTYEPLLLSATNSSLSKDGFLSSSAFQETKRILTKAAIEGASDWLEGLKDCVMVGRLISAGSAFLNYKNYLDNIYLFKD